MHVTIMGRRWEWKVVPRSSMPLDRNGEHCDGLCDGPDTKGKRLKFAHDLAGQNELETGIHEMLHACGWHIDEPFVEQAAHDMARILWNLGWKRQP